MTAAASPATPATMSYAAPGDIAVVRTFVRERAESFGLTAARVDMLMLAISELVTNTLQHTADGGRVRIWLEGARLGRAGRVVCEVLDGGPPRRFGRQMPAPDAERGRGLAIVELVCDEVQSMTGPDGSVVRLSLDLAA